mmetsp:Transcript_19056/g.24754  ORF Transcript_19056/g.24754 Transcript_19056/m.24754 type:complete len:113 (-) Transcript_19056:312-650(-)
MVEYTRESVNKLNVTRLIFPTKELSMRGFPFGRRTETYPTAPMTNTFPVADAAADITLPSNSDMFYDYIVTQSNHSVASVISLTSKLFRKCMANGEGERGNFTRHSVVRTRR